MSNLLRLLSYLNRRKLALAATLASLPVLLLVLYVVVQLLRAVVLIEAGAAPPAFEYNIWHHRLAGSPVTVGLAVYAALAGLLLKLPKLGYWWFSNIVDLWEDSALYTRPLLDGDDTGAPGQTHAQTYFG